MMFKSVPLVLQQESSECALACLTMIMNYYGDKRCLFDIRSQSSSRGMNLNDVCEAAESFNLETRAIRINLSELKYLKFPAILHWEQKHFVVITKIRNKRIYINDPAIGKKVYSFKEVSAKFTGVVLELSPNEAFTPVKEKTKINWKELFGNISGVLHTVGKIFVLAIVLELLLLLSPLYMQSIIDHVLVSKDLGLLNILMVAFIFIVFLQSAMYLIRSWSTRVFINSLGVVWEKRLFVKLLKLPINFFESRSLGEVLSRFGSIRTIQNVLAGNVIEVIMDGLMSVLAFYIMLVYSGLMITITSIALIIYYFIRLSLFSRIRSYVESEYTALAKQQSHAVETIRGIQTLKLFAGEKKRLDSWFNLLIKTTNESLSIARLRVNFEVLKRIIIGVERVVVIWYGSHMVLNQEFSVGMLIAFLAYREIFSSRASALIDRLMEFKLLKVHILKLTDITNTNVERQDGASFSDKVSSIKLSNLYFRYVKNESWVIKDLSLVIQRNQSIAIVGKSGCGKSTLVKLIVGLLVAEKGSIKINEKEINSIKLKDYRNTFGVVMQDDQLFAGNISQNIALFDENIDMKSVIDSAKSASIHDDIEKMVMGYNTLVGDMGSVFSGGQKQRILLARALYKQPKVLILDEATSHLDKDNEFYINQSVKKMSVICITVAHRKETIACADRVLEMKGGVIVRDCKPSEYLNESKN